MKYNGFGEIISRGIVVNNDIMRPGNLSEGQTILSADGSVGLLMSNGILGVYNTRTSQTIWQAGTSGNSGATFSFQASDGNLVIYTASGTPIWGANTQYDADSKNGFLRLQNDGNLVLYTADGSRAIWNSKGLASSAVSIQGDSKFEYFDYDNRGQLRLSNSGDGVYKVMYYDLQGNLTSEIRSALNDIRYVIDVNMSDTIRRTDNSYDALGRLIKQKQAARDVDGTSQRPEINRTYDRWGNLRSVSDARNASWITQYVYNANNQLTREIKPTVNVLNNDLSGYTDQTPTTWYYYDYAGNQVAVRDARGNINGKTYDAAGNVLTETNADGGWIQHVYNAFGNEVERTDAMGNVTKYEYDKRGLMTRIIRPDDGQLFSRTVSSEDDASDSRQAPVTLYSDSNYAGRISHFGSGIYNLNGDLSSLKVRAGWSVSLYGKSGNLQDIVTGERTSLGSLNDAVWKIDVSFINGPRVGAIDWTTAPTINMQYDSLGRQIAKTDGSGTTQYTYDLLGNVVKMSQPGGLSTTNRYDALNRKVSETNANGDTATWTYDYFGRLSSRTDIGGAVYSYTYDFAGQLTRETNTRDRDVKTSYNAAGQVIQIGDSIPPVDRRITRYEYDLSGRRTREETFTINSGLRSIKNLAYDALGQLTYAGYGGDAEVRYYYDTAGNRVKQSSYTTSAGNRTFYYAYDAVNRQIMVDGVTDNNVNNSANYNSSFAHRVAYDKNGNRTMDSTQNGTEYYSYDILNRLYKTTKGGVTIRRVWFDRADRVIEAYDASLLGDDGNQTQSNFSTSVYDSAGRVIRQYYKTKATIAADGEFMVSLGNDSSTVFNDTYDACGNLIESRRHIYGEGGTIITTHYDYAKFDSYKQSLVASGRWDNWNDFGRTTLSYDFNGYLTSINDEDKPANNRSFFNDVNGQVLQKKDNVGNVLKNLVVNGQVLGTYGNGTDYARTQADINAGIVDTNFSNYQIVDAVHPSMGPGSYRVNVGDTLQSIAQATYGDAALWYLIADANGLSSSGRLQAGTMLTLPNTVGTVHNNASTFKPYNPANIVGDTSPYVNPPPATTSTTSGCNKVTIIVAAVLAAVVISVVTMGAASAAGAGIIGLAVAGAVGGALGSAASQGIMIAGGLQQSFSWTDVGIGAATGFVAGGLMAGAGAAAQGIAKGSGFLARALAASLNCAKPAMTVAQKIAVTGFYAATAAASSVAADAVGQGLKIAANMQNSFSWKQTAAAAVTGAFSGASETGGVRSAIAGDISGSALGNLIVNNGDFDPTQFVGDIASSVGGAAVGAMMQKSARACFVAGTMIHAREGLLAIEQFVGGEQVLARNEETHEIAYRGVLSTKVTLEQAIWRVVVGDDSRSETETLRTTAEHPFWIKDGGWKKASLLQPGDQLLGRLGQVLTVHEAVAEGTNETVYNIEVAEFHTYHVGQIGVWVHNDNCGQKRLRSSSEGEDANPRPMERQRLDTEVVAFRRNTRSNTTIDRATDLANRATVDSAPAGNGGGLLEMRTRPSTDGNPTSVKNQARIAELADNKRYKEGAIRTHFKGFRDNQDMTPGIRPYIVESEPRNWTAEHREIRDAMSANLKRRNSFTPFENGSAAENSHLWATSLGGPNDRTNAPPASIHQNTEFLAIEQGLKVLTEQHGDRIRSKVTGYIDPTTGELNSARYKIYHQEDGNWVKKFDHLTDGRRSNIDLEEARGLRDAVQNVVNIPKIGAHAAAVVKGIMINSTAPAREAILAGRGNSIFSPLYTDSDVREL